MTGVGSLANGLRRYIDRETLQEFANRHLGVPRKCRRIARGWKDYDRRRNAARGIGDHECYPEIAVLRHKRVTGLRLDEELLQTLLTACRQRFEQAAPSDMAPQEGKAFYLDLLRAGDYEPTSPFMRFALGWKLLRTVSVYLGTAAFLQSVELIRSQTTPRDARLFRSQLWHCDNNNDTRMVKLFVHVTDVDSVNGPLTYIPYESGRRIPWYRGHYLSDETVSRFVPMDQKIELTGPLGTATMMDTASMFHCGSRCRAPRLMFVVHYNTGFGFLPRTEKHVPWLESARNLSQLQRLAVGVTAS